MKLQLSLILFLSLPFSLPLSVLHVTQMDSFNLIVISAAAVVSVGEGGGERRGEVEECVAKRDGA